MEASQSVSPIYLTLVKLFYKYIGYCYCSVVDFQSSIALLQRRRLCRTTTKSSLSLGQSLSGVLKHLTFPSDNGEFCTEITALPKKENSLPGNITIRGAKDAERFERERERGRKKEYGKIS